MIKNTLNYYDFENKSVEELFNIFQKHILELFLNCVNDVNSKKEIENEYQKFLSILISKGKIENLYYNVNVQSEYEYLLKNNKLYCVELDEYEKNKLCSSIIINIVPDIKIRIKNR